MCCCEAPGQERVRLTVAPTLTPRKRGKGDTSPALPWVSSKDLSTNHVSHLNSPQWILLVPDTPFGSWDRARTYIVHWTPHCSPATCMGRQGRKVSPSVGTSHPQGKRTKQRRQLLPLSVWRHICTFYWSMQFTQIPQDCSKTWFRCFIIECVCKLT